VTIKGSLLMSVPIIKRFFGRKFSKSRQNGVQKLMFFDFEVETPLGNQSPPEHVVWRKNGGDAPKNVFSRAAQEITKKN